MGWYVYGAYLKNRARGSGFLDEKDSMNPEFARALRGANRETAEFVRASLRNSRTTDSLRNGRMGDFPARWRRPCGLCACEGPRTMGSLILPCLLGLGASEIPSLPSPGEGFEDRLVASCSE